MTLERHLNDDRVNVAQLCLVDLDGIALYDAFCLKPFDPGPACRRRQADFGADVRQTASAIGQQYPKNGQVVLVKKLIGIFAI